MATPNPAGRTALPPNHHAHYPGFAGVGGLLAALSFTVARGADADLAVRLTGVGPGDHVVDVGCGPGVAVRRGAPSAASVVGIDPAPVMLRVARLVTRHRSSPTVRYMEGAAEALPLPDDSATVVWSLATVHHWQDLDAGLEESRRVLGPSGRLLAIERRVEPGARGHASHGWTDDQARMFADRCSVAGFADAEIGHHTTGRRRVVSVLANVSPRSTSSHAHQVVE
jgi:ubiquinone/menaquinone biosynthesis C-methylase UbiE